MKIVSWNVNGIRSTLKKGFIESMQSLDADIICLQETKSPKQAVEMPLDGYEQYWNHATRPGYSGTAIFSRTEPISVQNGINIEKHDQEGRVLTCEYDKFFLVNVYVPNAKRALERLPYRHQEWDPDFLKYLKGLDKKKPVIFCGDLNVAHTEMDLSNPKGNVKNHGFTPEEREGFDNFIEAGFIDTFRVFEKAGQHYTWWSLMHQCRARNIGWRIDYFCASQRLKKKLKSSTILKDVMGSDHCPVQLEIDI